MQTYPDLKLSVDREGCTNQGHMWIFYVRNTSSAGVG